MGLSSMLVGRRFQEEVEITRKPEMFERAAFRRSDQKTEFHLDIGQLAETLLFYGEVDLLLDRANFGQLLKVIGPDALIRLVQLPTVNAVFVEDDLATLTNNYGFLTHKFIAFAFVGKDREKPVKSKRERVREIFQFNLGKGWRSKKQADFISQHLSEGGFGQGLAGPNLIDGAMKDLFNPDFTREAVRLIIEERVPSVNLPGNFTFSPLSYGEDFIIDTDLDFTGLAVEYRKFWPEKHSSLTPALVLSEILQSRASLGLSAALGADILTTSTASNLINLKMTGMGNGAAPVRSEVSEFSEWVLEGKSIAGVLRDGGRDFHELLDVVEASGEFKKWVLGVDQDKNLAKEYFREINSTGWLNKLPNKALRYMTFAGASTTIGLVASPPVGAAAGAALSAVDTFFLDRLVGGWKPNHFVDRRIKPFIGQA